MKFTLAMIFTLLCAKAVDAITIDTVPVGNLGNANDPGFGYLYGLQGSVNYAYNIGKYEVTVGQYTAFLNAVAATDLYGLYNTSMATNLNIAGIARSGASGSYTYSVIGSPNHPITYVNWGDAARFANWLHNGQPTGSQNVSTTENGAYTLNGVTLAAALLAITRNANATWFIPTANEWYKAAYYQPVAQGGDADNYWKYPMRTNSVPFSDQPPGATPDNTRVGNLDNNDATANGYDDGYAVTGSTTKSSSQNYLTDVGAYNSSPSYYGTFDQGGSVFEWNETQNGVSSRGARGGSWGDSSNYLSASNQFYPIPTSKYDILGFRVAAANPGFPGDYNIDGVVDSADYVIWRKRNGPQSDYNQWRTHFGQPSGSGAASSQSAAVPEPVMIMLLAIVGCASVATRRRKSVPYNRV